MNKPQKEMKMRTHNINLSVYQYPCTWKSLRGFWRNIRQWFDNRRAVKQRAKMGYSHRDVWNCGDHLIDLTLAMLIEFRNNTNNWPDLFFDTFEDWIAFIDKVIDLLDYSRQDADEFNSLKAEYDKLPHRTSTWTDEQKRLFDDYLVEAEAICQQQQKARIEAFTLLAPYLKDLWW